MFDDKPMPGQATAPKNLPAEPADILKEVEQEATAAAQPLEAASAPTALNAGLLRKKDAPSSDGASAPLDKAAPAATAMPAYAMREPVLGKVLLLIFFGVLLAGIGYGGWWFYSKFSKQGGSGELGGPAAPAALPAPAPPVSPTLPAEVTGRAASEMQSDQILFGEQIDTDMDSLDDIREKSLGLDSKKADSDGDGLSDGDEVIIWKTDPLNPDTDGDGHADGKEVYNGYNPLGPGKLFNVPPKTATTTR